MLASVALAIHATAEHHEAALAHLTRGGQFRFRYSQIALSAHKPPRRGDAFSAGARDLDVCIGGRQTPYLENPSTALL